MTMVFDQMTAEASDNYTDTDTHEIKKRAGRRPALTKTIEARDDKSPNVMTIALIR